MPNPTEPTAPSGEEQAVTIGRETYVRNGTSWRHHHRWGPIVCDETSDILSRLSALHTELERTRAENDKLRALWGEASRERDEWKANAKYAAENYAYAVQGETDERKRALGSPDDTTRRTE